MTEKNLAIAAALVALGFVAGCGQSSTSYSSDVSQQQPKPQDSTPHFKNPGKVFGKDPITPPVPTGAAKNDAKNTGTAE